MNQKKINREKPVSNEHLFHLFGIRPIEEAIRKQAVFKKLYLQKISFEDQKKSSESLQNFWIDYCRKKKIQFRFVEKSELDLKTSRQNHQGVVAELKEGVRAISDLEKFVDQLEELPVKELGQGASKVILIIDRLTDQQNMGAVARSAYYFGCRLVIAENHHNAPIDATVHKISSGASLLLPFYFCEKLSRSIDLLKKNGYYILATSANPEMLPLKEVQFPNQIKKDPKIVIIVGAEGEGVRPHLIRQSDCVSTIQRESQFDSLNVSVATGIVLYEVMNKIKL